MLLFWLLLEFIEVTDKFFEVAYIFLISTDVDYFGYVHAYFIISL